MRARTGFSYFLLSFTIVSISHSQELIRPPEINAPVISSYRDAISASADEMFRDFQSHKDWEDQFYSVPGIVNTNSSDALLTYMEMQDYAETRAAAATSVFKDDMAAFGLKLYNRGKKNKSGADLYGEVQAHGGTFLYNLDKLKTLITDPIDSFLLEFRKNFHSDQLMRVQDETVFQEINDGVKKFIRTNGIDENALNIIRAKLDSAWEKFEQGASELEQKTIESDQSPEEKANSEKKSDLIAALGRAKNSKEIEEVSETAKEEGFENIKAMADAVSEFASETNKYVNMVGGIAQIASGIGVDIPPEATKAINTASMISSGVAAFASGNFIGGTLSVIGALGSKKPDPAMLRFQAIMGRLDTIVENQMEILENQQLILANQRKIFRRLDQLEFIVREGVAKLEFALQESTELIIEAIFREDDRDVGRCLISGAGGRMSFFPRESDVKDIGEQPSGTFLTAQNYIELTADDATVDTRTAFFSENFGNHLEDCRKVLVYILEGLQTGRGVDPYFRLSRIDELKKDIEENPGKEQIKLNNVGVFASNYRAMLEQQTNVLEKWIDELNFGDGFLSKTDKLLLLAFDPPFKPNCQEPLCNFDKRLSSINSEDSSRLRTYFTGPGISNVDDIKDKILAVGISSPTLFYVAKRLLEVHPYLSIANFENANIQSFPEQRNSTLELQTYRLLLETNRLLEVLRAQQAILDGRAHVELAWLALFRRDGQIWNELSVISETNGQFRLNLEKYIFARALNQYSVNGAREFEIVLESGLHSWTSNFIKKVFARYNADANLVCEFEMPAPSKELFLGECTANDLQGTGIGEPLVEISLKLDDGALLPRARLRLPKPIDLFSNSFALSSNARAARRFHNDYRRILTNYRPNNFYEATDREDTEFIRKFDNFLLHTRLVDMGFTAPKY